MHAVCRTFLGVHVCQISTDQNANDTLTYGNLTDPSEVILILCLTIAEDANFHASECTSDMVSQPELSVQESSG